jgi:hypothetical protein
MCRLALARDIVGHDVETTRQMGWTTIKNGELLTLAAEHLDVFVTGKVRQRERSHRNDPSGGMPSESAKIYVR